MVQLNLKGLAGLCHCQGIIRLLSFTICQANRLRKCCILSLHFHSIAERGRLNIEATHVLTQYCTGHCATYSMSNAEMSQRATKLFHNYCSAGTAFCTTYWQVRRQSVSFVCLINLFFSQIFFCDNLFLHASGLYLYIFFKT